MCDLLVVAIKQQVMKIGFRCLGIGLLGLVWSCAPCRVQANKMTSKKVDSALSLDTLCYLAKVSGKEDTYSVIRLAFTKHQVRGLLTYNYSGYIRSGTLEGWVKADTLDLVWHHFIGDQAVQSDFKFLLNKKTQQLQQVEGSRPAMAEYRRVACQEVAHLFD